jgi:hypothetical protein
MHGVVYTRERKVYASQKVNQARPGKRKQFSSALRLENTVEGK